MNGWMMHHSNIPSPAAAPLKGPSCGSALLFPRWMGLPAELQGSQPCSPSSQGSSGFLSWLIPLALSMPVSSCFPSYPNTALFLAAGNPSWADNTSLESDLKSFLSFFLMLEVRKASTFSFSPGEGEIAAGPVGRDGGTFGCLHGPSAQVEHPGGWGRDSGMWLEPGKRRCRVPGSVG